MGLYCDQRRLHYNIYRSVTVMLHNKRVDMISAIPGEWHEPTADFHRNILS